MILQKNRQLNELQSLRGLAALTVLLHHCSFYYAYNHNLKKISEIFFNAHAAVVIFFVLSGYVLCLSLSRNEQTPAALASFYVRRAFRIYPALYVALGLAFIYALLFRGQSPPAIVSPWWEASHRAIPNWRQVAVMLTGIQSPLAVPLWTLKIELAASILLPFVAMAAARQPAAIWITAIIYIFCVWEGYNFSTMPLYLSGFVFGAMIVYNLPVLKRFIPGIALTGFLLMWFGRLMFHAGFEEDYHNAPSVIVEGVGAMMLVWAIAAQPEAFALLRHRFLIWLGDISYSLYLVHLSILGLITGFGTERLGLAFMTRSGEVATIVAMAATLAVTLLISDLIYRYIELPMIAMGKTVAKMIERRIDVNLKLLRTVD